MDNTNNRSTIITIVVIIVIILIGWWIYSASTSSPGTGAPSPNEFGNIATSTGGETTTTPGQSTTSGQEASSSAASNSKEFVIDAQNYSFSPKVITVNKGDTVNIKFNVRSGTHSFNIDAFNISTGQLGPGQSETVSFTADKTGSFPYYCSVDSHREKGMVGSLNVR